MGLFCFSGFPFSGWGGVICSQKNWLNEDRWGLPLPGVTTELAACQQYNAPHPLPRNITRASKRMVTPRQHLRPMTMVSPCANARQVSIQQTKLGYHMFWQRKASKPQSPVSHPCRCPPKHCDPQWFNTQGNNKPFSRKRRDSS